MNKEEIKVELFNCWKWICPNCDCTNYHNGNNLKLNANEKESLLEQMSEYFGVDVDNDNDLIMIPEIVFCKKCEGKFKTSAY